MRTANIACARSTVIKGAGRRMRLSQIGAALLLACAPSMVGAAPGTPPTADPSFPFSNEIEAFAKANNAGQPQRDAALFLGSSSIRMWDIGASFADIRTVNRGFGGATTPDVLHYYPRLLPPAPPRAVVVYVGDNDLAAGHTPEEVARDLLALLKRLRADYPRVPIAFLSLKPSPIRWTLYPKMMQVNAALSARAGKERFDYLDVGATLLATDGLPDASLFRSDGLHMNANGYRRWTKIVDDWLDHANPLPSIGQKSS